MTTYYLLKGENIQCYYEQDKCEIIHRILRDVEFWKECWDEIKIEEIEIDTDHDVEVIQKILSSVAGYRGRDAILIDIEEVNNCKCNTIQNDNQRKY